MSLRSKLEKAKSSVIEFIHLPSKIVQGLSAQNSLIQGLSNQADLLNERLGLLEKSVANKPEPANLQLELKTHLFPKTTRRVLSATGKIRSGNLAAADGEKVDSSFPLQLADGQNAHNQESCATLSEWLVSFWKTPEYDSLLERIQDCPDALTPPEEATVLYALIQYLRPKRSLEIGTWFAQTARVMAEAIVEANIDGKIITLDPFGEERVPRIVQSWPEELRRVTDFYPWNSMQFFLELETQHAPKGIESPMGLVFVDGHHNFEYVLYDIIRSADHIAPGGAIVLDNLEQDGPKSAVIQFLLWNPAWSLFCQGNIMSADNMMDLPVLEQNWGVLIAPLDVQVGKRPVKLMKRNGISYSSMRALSFNLQRVSHSGKLDINLQYYAVPFNYHITGKGLIYTRFKSTIPISDSCDSKILLELPSALKLDLPSPDMNIRYELELSYNSDASECAFLLLDAENPVDIIS